MSLIFSSLNMGITPLTRQEEGVPLQGVTELLLLLLLPIYDDQRDKRHSSAIFHPLY